MNIREVIAAINQMEADVVIDHYAIGGAVGATFYLEPVATLDVDVFVVFRPVPGSRLVNTQPVFEYLKQRGGTMEGEYVFLGGWPVQFLASTGALVDEALAEAVLHDVEGIPTRVFTAEHLAAIALETGRAKDKARLLQFIESEAFNLGSFQEIVHRHGMTAAWVRFQRQFLSDAE